MIKVLLFEDNQALREALSYLIGHTEGLDVVGTYGNCVDAVEQVKKHEPDVVLMDIDLPGKDGIAAMREIKKRYAFVDVLMLTVFDDDDRVFQSIKAGATGYLLKKTPPARLVEAIREVYEGGAPMSPSIARRLMKYLHQRPSSATALGQLTDREFQILGLLSEGKSYKMIASECLISVETVRTHIKHLYEKLHVHSVAEAVALFLKR